MSIYFKTHRRYNNVCLKLNESSEDVLCTDNDFGFDGDDGNDLITWTLPRERITKGIDVFEVASPKMTSVLSGSDPRTIAVRKLWSPQ